MVAAMKRRWIYPKDGEPFEVTEDYLPEPRTPMIFGDTPGYQSPVTGLWVDGKVQRREDLKRAGSRPWEGLAEERREAQRQQGYHEQQLDASLAKAAAESFYQLPPSKREILKRGLR